MDSYSFHFERMSNVDLHPLSLPISRLSPAKSNSSIVEQLAHHQHGKGDSAYSSFSGGSTAPDYPSSFLPDDLQSSSFSHYADLRYVKSIGHPAPALQSDSKTMDQLYRSVEAISQQYCPSTKENQHNANDGSYTYSNILFKQETPLSNPSQSASARVPPPPVPARLDSFIATKNLENSNLHHHDTEFPTQHPQPQLQPRPYGRPHQPPPGINLPRAETPNPESAESDSFDPVSSVWGGTQPQQAQGQQPPIYRLHLQPHDQTAVPLTQEHRFVTDNKAAPEQQKSTSVLSRSPPRGTGQTEHVKPRQSSASNGDRRSKSGGSGNRFESQRKRAHSAHDGLGSERSQTPRPWNAGFINSSIQHKGQFYFVTGVCKLSESGVRTHSASVCGSEAGSDSSNVLEKYQLREKQRSHSTMDNLFRPFQGGSHTSGCSIPDERETLPREKGLPCWSQDQENHTPSLISEQSSRSFDALEDVDVMQSRDISRHTASNPIFYCGPDRNSPPLANLQKKEMASSKSKEMPEGQMPRGKRQPLGDVASERINKETTPLLYHLTGANRAALQLKHSPDLSLNGKETALNKTSSRDAAINDDDRPMEDDTGRKDGGEVVSVACNTLDDSFKKYYKEKLKDAQSKVLRETSFKRRDLQLSWPHRIRQKLDLRPTVIHSFTPSQDSESSTDTLTPSVQSEDTERGSVKDEAVENQKKIDRDAEQKSRKPVNVAQPQVARVGGRKRLTAEQKKMCYSEPEKLNQLGGAPSHSACRSFGYEGDSLFAAECPEEEREQHREQGLVAARRKMFETRGRALSASSALKTNLKNLQHKALVDYMERKTGQKLAEPPQPASQPPAPARQRHSLGEKPFDWGSRPPSGNQEGKNTKKGNRPHSAGRILDSSTSSSRYAQFFSAQSCSGQYAGQSSQARWRESQGPSQVKSASVESLLEQPEPPSFFRNRSTSTPLTLQADDCETELLPADTLETCRPQKNPIEDQSVKPEPEGRQLVRVVAQRGKSMEELRASKIKKPTGLSKSSEQLDQLWRSSTGPARSSRDVPFIVEARGTEGQERGRKKQPLLEQAGKELETVLQGQNQNHKKSVIKQDSEPRENSSRPTSPVQCRAHCGSAGSQGPVTDELRSSDTSSNPPSPRGLETSEREMKSTSCTPTHTKLPFDNRPCFRARTPPSASGSQREQSVDEPMDDTPPLEVSLSCGVTTDPSLWMLPPEDELKNLVQTSPATGAADDILDHSSGPNTQTSETSVSPRADASDADVSHQREEKSSETEEGTLGENQEVKEKAAPEGRTKNLERPAETPQWEELVEEVVKADQSLASVLYPLTNRKTALMLMEQLLSEDTLLMEEHYKKKQEQRGAAESDEASRGEGTQPCPEGLKAQCTDELSKTDIAEKKRLLVSCVERRLRSLEQTHAALQAELQENVARGEALQVLVRERCLPVEQERYGLFIGDLERVVSLLLCLSARLARVQNALSTVDQHTDAEEKQSLDSRHRLLCKQREDAKDLKDNLDRRESLVSSFLSRQLSAEQLQEYRRFVQTKASLLIRQKDLEEKQRLVEEQLEALSYSLSL